MRRVVVIAFGLSAIVACCLPACADPVNVASQQLGATARTDCCYSDAYPGSAVIDGRVDHGPGCWFSADSTQLPCAVTIDLGQEYSVRAVALTQASWTGSMYHTKDFAVEAAAEGGEFVRVGEGTLPDESLARLAVTFEPRQVRLVRVIVLTSYMAQQTCGLAEVEVLADGVLSVEPPAWTLDGRGPAPVSDSAAGFRLVAFDSGAQVAVMEFGPSLAAAVRAGETARMEIAMANIGPGTSLSAVVSGGESSSARVTLRCAGASSSCVVKGTSDEVTLQVPEASEAVLELEIDGLEGEATVRCGHLALHTPNRDLAVPLVRPAEDPPTLPPPITPALRPAIEDALIEWDWRMQDGIGTPREPSTWRDACEEMVRRGEELAREERELGSGSVSEQPHPRSPAQPGTTPSPLAERGDGRRPGGEVGAALDAWREACRRFRDGQDPTECWLALHRAKRAMALGQPLFPQEPILFAKYVPGSFSHQLTQYYGRYARPGGGVFVLSNPGRSMACRELWPGQLPVGSFMQPEMSYDGTRVLFAFCEAPTPPEDAIQGHHGRYYHLYEGAISGAARQLTGGAFDDFAPRYLPDGRIVFISTRRLGWHRCGNPGCENYTLAIANPDGSDPHTVSYHETQEWDPAVLNDGRIVYTRWDYVDRHAIFYEQLWTVGADGASPAALYGNNTLNPVGVWEAHAVPGSYRIMATAAAHHAMTAGSVILVDPAVGVDGPGPITRLTPDVPFPESEDVLAPGWRAPIPGGQTVDTPASRRWPGHCFRSPYPLSETQFLAAYSFDGLIGEPRANEPNMFGIYWVDSHGNKELLYRDPNISSLWPAPVRPRARPPLMSVASAEEAPVGRFVVQDVTEGTPALPGVPLKSLRIVQVVPKSTPGANNPRVGLAFASPGHQVLGTVPIEPDGSAYFEAPVGVPLGFQVLDERGCAVQVMRSITYLQPGQTLSCVGCHERRDVAPPNREGIASQRPPSRIRPGPDGSKPLSYPLLVQPVLNAKCVSCHGATDPAGGVRLTGEPEGEFTVSYNALAPRVTIAQWYGGPEFVELNSEPLAKPDFFGARGSSLGALVLSDHYGAKLSDDDIERLVTWMDANALFYGTFDPAGQARQRNGERIAGPGLE